MQGLSPVDLGGAPNFLALIRCGSVADEHGVPGAVHSETALVLAVQGDEDLYTVQWAERSAPILTRAAFNTDLWMGRLKQLQPIKVCAKQPGEAAPYPSCLR